MIKVGVIFGTRPEAIKMAPIILEMEKHQGSITPIVIVTSQHNEMLKQPLELFQIKPDFNLEIMRSNQNLFDISVNILSRIEKVLRETSPDVVLVQGDTSTTMLSALGAFYLKIKVGHVEAGLRTQDRYNPFPEEMNRRLVGTLADFHFAPTKMAKQNLLRAGVSDKKIIVTGNTSIDAINWVLKHVLPERGPILEEKFSWLNNNKRMLLITAHRRESFGAPLAEIIRALRTILERNKDVSLAFPVHLNPNVRKVVYRHLGGLNRAHLIDPVSYEEFVYLMKRSYIILTDSGGIQEEAPSLGKPVLVLRKTTERPEGVETGNNRVVGTDGRAIIEATEELLNYPATYNRMASASNPFGDGMASQQIVNWLMRCDEA
jgi:UDP-N-acetylglucosamine 2-epimerase (non-hydrolysing)